ncbi:MAG: glycosyltransferase family 39 protein, partial [Thermodesulfobacteriota bacterium]
VLPVLLAVARSAGPPGRVGEVRFLAVSVAVMLISRGPWAAWTPTLPVSDFALYDEIATRVGTGEAVPYRWPSMAVIAAWGYAVALGATYAVLGPGVEVAKGLNVALAAAAVVALYLLARDVAGVRVARAAVLLLLLWPGQLVYVGVLGSEHLAVPLLLLGLWCVTRAVAAPASERALLPLAGAGFLLACTFLTRAALGTALVAALLALLLERGRSVSRRLARAGVVAAVFVATTIGYTAAVERAIGVAPVSGGWWSLLVGSNVASGGAWNAADVERFTAYADRAAANRFAREEAWRRMSVHPAGYARLALRKIDRMWSDGTSPVFWSTLAVADAPAAATLSRIAPRLAALSQTFHVLVLLLGAIGLLLLARDGRATRAALPALLFLLLGTLAHGVVETQARYNYPLQPVVFVFAAVALVRLGTLTRG